MKDKKNATLLPSTEVIALPPLKMILVHAKDEHEAALSAVIESAEPREEQVKPQVLKRLIAHLEQKRPPTEERG